MTSPTRSRAPVCVLGLGLIGGSLLRALTVAGREAFGFDRSADGADAARRAGFDASTNIAGVLSRAATTNALIVLAVPVPALPAVLHDVHDHAPQNPLTDVVSVKAAVLELVARHGLLAHYVGGHPMAGTAHSGWAASDADLFIDAPWVIGVDDHVDPLVWARVMHLALDCGAFVVPASSDEHDVAVAAISHLPHVLAEALAVAASDVPLGFALAAGSFRDGTRVAATAPDLVRAMCEANSKALTSTLDRAIYLLQRTRDGLADTASVVDLVEDGYAARTSYDGFRRHDVASITLGAPEWRTELAAAGRAGGVIRSALPVLGSRG